MKTLRIALVALGIAMIAMPAGAVAKQGQNGKLKSNAARLCKQLKKDMGADAFKAAYGSNENKSNAKGKCVKYTKRTLRSMRAAAREACAQPAPATAAKNGGNSENRGSGKTRRDCLRAATSDDVASVKQAQAECRAELAADPVAFDAKYGSDENDPDNEGRDDRLNDDFADCVDEHAKAIDAANDAA
jgi:hypothetical protein